VSFLVAAGMYQKGLFFYTGDFPQLRPSVFRKSWCSHFTSGSFKIINTLEIPWKKIRQHKNTVENSFEALKNIMEIF